MTGTTTKNRETRSIDPDPTEGNDSSGDVIYHPNGTVSFSDGGRMFWRPRLVKIGIDIDTIKTRADWGLALELSVTADTDRKSSLTELAAALRWTPSNEQP